MIAFSLPTLIAILGSSRAAAADPPPTQTGSIKGRLVWVGDIPEPDVLARKNDPHAKDPEAWASHTIRSRSLIIDSKTRGISSAFAYLVNPRGFEARGTRANEKPQSEVRVNSDHCELLPHCAAMEVNQALVIGNRDKVAHHVSFFSQQYPKGPNWGLGPPVLNPGAVQKVKFERPEPRPIMLRCDLHAWESSRLMVFDHPFFALSRPDGSFEIQRIPPGPQHLVVWHERAGYVGEQQSRGIAIDIKAGAVTEIGELKISRGSLKQ
jgi:hypothetical protein